MSNIFDALKKKQELRPPAAAPGAGGAPFPFHPQDRKAMLNGRLRDVRLGRQLDALRERIELELPRAGRRAFGIAGSVAGEGATTVGLELARALSRSGDGKVLLVDADFSPSKGTLSYVVSPSESRPGLGDLLLGRADLSRAVLSTDEANLHFLPSGRDSTGPVELGTERMRQFLEDMGRLYRILVIDCPPVLDFPEAPALGSLADGMVLVVRANRTRREVAQRALSLLDASRCRVMGIVLNHRQFPVPDFLYRRI